MVCQIALEQQPSAEWNYFFLATQDFRPGLSHPAPSGLASSRLKTSECSIRDVDSHPIFRDNFNKTIFMKRFIE